MALQSHPLSALQHFLPQGSLDLVWKYMHQYAIHLKIKKERRRVYGDYRPAHGHHPHTISVNGNLHPYHFLITFLHELAHLITFIEYRHRVAPHGKEWKNKFAAIIRESLQLQIFPPDIEQALMQSLHNPSASSCSDPVLFKTLRTYEKTSDKLLIEELQPNDFFIHHQLRFQMIEKRRSKYVCKRLSDHKLFLFPGMCEVYKE